MGKKKQPQQNAIVVVFTESDNLSDESIATVADAACEQLESMRNAGAERFGGLLVLPESRDSAEAFSRFIGNLTCAGLMAVTASRDAAAIPPEQLN